MSYGEFLTRCRLQPYDHQLVGIERLIKLDDVALGRVLPGCFALFDEMGAGKTLQIIVAAQILFLMNLIDRVVVIAPASVKSVWYDPEFGELKKHLFEDLHVLIEEFHTKRRRWTTGKASPDGRQLHVVITNYEYIRVEARLLSLIPACTHRTWLVLDESSAVKNYRAEQTKACLKLRNKVTRVTLLNGTPIANNPLDMYAQGLLMDKRILDVKNFFHMRAKYAVMGGWMQKQVLSWQNLDDLQRRFAPYVLRRLKVECLDLPAKLPPVLVTVPLTPKTWGIYKEMRDDMVSWLSHTDVALAQQAGVKAMRLAQICAGFLGGIIEIEPQTEEFELDQTRPAFIPTTSGRAASSNYVGQQDAPEARSGTKPKTQEIGREKLDAFFDWLDTRLEEDPNLKLLVWCRFRPELARILEEIKKRDTEATACLPHNLQIGTIWGGQKKGEREETLSLLDPRSAPAGPVIVLGTPASGSMGLNLAAAHQVIYLSNDFSLKTRLQSEDRVHRPGQVYPVSYTDVIATGPTGQKTVDHIIMKALRMKEDVANWTAKAWISALTEE